MVRGASESLSLTDCLSGCEKNIARNMQSKVHYDEVLGKEKGNILLRADRFLGTYKNL